MDGAYFKTVRILMERGGKLSFDQGGNTGLHIAARKNFPDIVEMLVLGYQWNVNTVSTLLFHFFVVLKIKSFIPQPNHC